MVTYENLFLFGTFIVSLVSLCYKIFKTKKQPPLLPIMTAVPVQAFKLILFGVSRVTAFPLYLHYNKSAENLNTNFTFTANVQVLVNNNFLMLQ